MKKAVDMLGSLPRVEKHLTLQGVLKVHAHSSDDNKPIFTEIYNT